MVAGAAHDPGGRFLTIAGWLVSVDPRRHGVARAGLESLPGVSLRGEAGGRLVVVSESETALEAVDAALRDVAGVRDVALAAAFAGDDPDEEERP